jgi:hypothetical protein
MLWIDSCIIEFQADKVEAQRLDISKKDLKIFKLKNNRKYLLIFGALIGVLTNLI